MKILAFGFLALGICWLPGLVSADSNGHLGTGSILNSESVNLGAGPFNHFAPIPNAGNSIVTPNFVGGFNANRVRFIGTLTKVAGGTFMSEADIRVEKDATLFNWQNPGGATSSWTSFNYDSTQTISSTAAAGSWTVTFYDSFNDAGDPDETSSNVTMELQEVDVNTDTNGNWNIGNIGAFSPVSRVGEFAVGGVHDRYAFTTTSALTFNFGTDFQNVLLNTTADTEIGVFDAVTGNIVAGAFDDDSGPGLYSQLNNLLLNAGSYVVVVGSFDVNFSNASTLGNLTFGTGTGDYVLNISAVPEPASLALVCGVSVLGLVFGARRRQN